MTRGKFITFEGIDGAGKTTHLSWFWQRLEQHLAQSGARVVMTREPGGTEIGEALRQVLLHGEMHPDTETLLMFAARSEHLQQVILPALARGDWVISDRFTDATFAYQGGGRGCARSKLEALEEWVQDGLRPDLTLLLDVPTETAHARLGAARARDKFERQSLVFFERVRNEYLRRAHETPERFLIINAARTIPEIQVELEKIIARL